MPFAPFIFSNLFENVINIMILMLILKLSLYFRSDRYCCKRTYTFKSGSMSIVTPALGVGATKRATWYVIVLRVRFSEEEVGRFFRVFSLSVPPLLSSRVMPLVLAPANLGAGILL